MMTGWQLALCALAFVSGAVGLGLAGLFATRGWVKLRMSNGHQVVGQIFLTAVGFYSILLGFVAVIVWQRFDAMDQAVTEEAAALIGVFRDTQAFPEPYRSEAQRALRYYAEVGIPSEWTNGGNAHILPHTTPDLLNPVWDVYRKVQAKAGASTIYLDAVERLRSLELKRHLRHLASQETLPTVFWWVLVVGAVVTTLTSYANYVEDLGMHAGLTVLAAALVGMIFFLIWALDAPFQGPVRLSQGAFQHALQEFNAITLPSKNGIPLFDQMPPDRSY
jgi:hypothetical protein